VIINPAVSDQVFVLGLEVVKPERIIATAHAEAKNMQEKKHNTCKRNKENKRTHAHSKRSAVSVCHHREVAVLHSGATQLSILLDPRALLVFLCVCACRRGRKDTNRW
jgi:hypothetical protein